MPFPTDKFVQFINHYPIPDYVKPAGTSAFTQISDPRTKVACYCARFAALAGETELSDREHRKRAEIFNISNDIAALERDYADFLQKSVVKTAAPTEKYPVRNKTEFEAASGWLKKNAYALPLPERRELAEKLIKKAAEYRREEDEQIVKFAGHGIGDVKTIIPNLMKRAELIRVSRLNDRKQREKTAQHLEDLAEIVKLQPTSSTTVESLDKIAATLQFIDGEYGLHGHYGFIDPPDDAAFPHSNKIAEEIEQYACKLGENVYDVRNLEKLKIADIIDTFGEDFAVAMTDALNLDHKKIATVVSVMTDLEKAVFADLVKEADIEPQYQEYETVDLKALTKLFK